MSKSECSVATPKVLPNGSRDKKKKAIHGLGIHPWKTIFLTVKFYFLLDGGAVSSNSSGIMFPEV